MRIAQNLFPNKMATLEFHYLVGNNRNTQHCQQVLHLSNLYLNNADLLRRDY